MVKRSRRNTRAGWKYVADGSTAGSAIPPTPAPPVVPAAVRTPATAPSLDMSEPPAGRHECQPVPVWSSAGLQDTVAALCPHRVVTVSDVELDMAHAGVVREAVVHVDDVKFRFVCSGVGASMSRMLVDRYREFDLGVAGVGVELDRWVSLPARVRVEHAELGDSLSSSFRVRTTAGAVGFVLCLLLAVVVAQFSWSVAAVFAGNAVGVVVLMLWSAARSDMYLRTVAGSSSPILLVH